MTRPTPVAYAHKRQGTTDAREVTSCRSEESGHHTVESRRRSNASRRPGPTTHQPAEAQEDGRRQIARKKGRETCGSRPKPKRTTDERQHRHTMSPAWLIAAAIILAALPLAAITTRHLAWRHARRRAETEWWRP